MPKSYDANVKPDPERWIPKQERSTYRVKGKNKKAANKGPQGAAVEGGGIGGTGSANIGGKKPAAPAAPVEKTPETPAKPATQSSSSKSKKKKGKGKNKW
jgi:signal recognition particle subunit SRP72